MKTILLLGIACLLVGFLTGCVTAKKTSAPDMQLIQAALDVGVPPTHTGYANFVHANQYFEITIEADGLRRDEAGWHFTWLTYERKSHFPIFSGLTWSSTGKITLGKKP
ncbi:MAG: hypothetical protein KF897_15030 [Opitutaceae bacterium]|nr:hypothetical protein [Opitutaceae bacterium]